LRETERQVSSSWWITGGSLSAHVRRGLSGQHLVHVEDVEHEHGVVGDQRAARLAEDVGVRDLRLLAGLLDRGHDVVRVLLHGVVRGRRPVRGRAVVVHAEAAAHVQELEPRARLHQLDVDPAHLAHRVLDRPDRRDLRADVEVEQLEAVEHPGLAQPVHEQHDLGGGEAELGAIPGGLHPLAGAARRELRAHADVRADPQPARHLEQHLQLAIAVDDHDRVAPQLLGEQRRSPRTRCPCSR
jgi:hypothetical protein